MYVKFNGPWFGYSKTDSWLAPVNATSITKRPGSVKAPAPRSPRSAFACEASYLVVMAGSLCQ